MPELQLPARDSHAFTVINHEQSAPAALAAPPRCVHVVRPLQRDDAPPPAARDQLTAAGAPQTILDPKFTRALDFKLRRLQDKELLRTNLRRPTRRRRAAALAASDPDVSRRDPPAPKRSTSRSQPQMDAPAPKPDKSPSLKSRSKAPGCGDGDKPRFVTTVKTGQFLPPPPDVASLLRLHALYPARERERVVFEYASKPTPVAPRSLLGRRGDRPPNGVPPGAPGDRPSPAGAAFRGVRALIAGVAGVRHLLERRDHVGSLATAATGATGATGATSYSNLMHDKRVVRGSTFGSHPQAAGDGLESDAARAARTRRRALARRAALARLRPGTPPPAPGRRHHPIQTDYYLEELFDKGAELEVGVQTDLFADRPATPAYVPAKTGADACTQIHAGDLFDFDLEVQPILELLVGKTTEQSLAEVAQEEELAALREQQRRYRELRDAELAERQRLAAQDERLQREKERRVAEARAARSAGGEARARVAAATLVQGYVAELLPSVLAGLRDAGYLLRRLQRGVEEEFMPWLVDEVSHEIESIITSRDVLTEIVRDVVEARAELYGAAGERLARRRSPPDSPTPPDAPEEAESEE